ncbi:class I SAM-dependent methyltransferase [Mesorhizobium sp. KR9-304]|uniref:class I SAM-dependent methyltransferase n=1 Tax=Mesorhizobium sp. KR9-304 TaxID=3156614 RepID=UPI0032B42746
MPQKPDYPLLRQSVFEQALLLIENVLGRKGTLIDLGAGHCGFSRIANAMGWKATALDVRTARRPDLPPEIAFIHADLNSEAWNPDDYDLILCLGVYYHLDQTMQHALLRRCRGKPLIIDTHFANPAGTINGYGLGDVYELNGETGADFKEAPDLDENTRKSMALLSSFINPTSWWQTKDSLLQTIHDHGWPHVWMFDYPTIDEVQRSFFVCHTIDQNGGGISGTRFVPFGR